MGSVKKVEKEAEIARRLLAGEAPNRIRRKIRCSLSTVFRVMQSQEFASQAIENIDKTIQSLSLIALHNIGRIAFDEDASQATRLKASQFLVDKGIDSAKLGGSAFTPSTMSQDQLIKTLDNMQKERDKRMKELQGESESIPPLIEHTLADLTD
jgi:hypothetical protein